MCVKASPSTACCCQKEVIKQINSQSIGLQKKLIFIIIRRCNFEFEQIFDSLQSKKMAFKAQHSATAYSGLGFLFEQVKFELLFGITFNLDNKFEMYLIQMGLI